MIADFDNETFSNPTWTSSDWTLKPLLYQPATLDDIRMVIDAMHNSASYGVRSVDGTAWVMDSVEIVSNIWTLSRQVARQLDFDTMSMPPMPTAPHYLTDELTPVMLQVFTVAELHIELDRLASWFAAKSTLAPPQPGEIAAANLAVVAAPTSATNHRPVVSPPPAEQIIRCPKGWAKSKCPIEVVGHQVVKLYGRFVDGLTPKQCDLLKFWVSHWGYKKPMRNSDFVEAGFEHAHRIIETLIKRPVWEAVLKSPGRAYGAGYEIAHAPI